MRVLLTGASGMLAAEVVPQLSAHGYAVVQTDFRPRSAEITQLDICDFEKVFSEIAQVNPDMIFHLGAETDVDLCEQDPDHAFRVNTLGTENIVLACRKNRIPLVYISTGSVFPGQSKQPYTEFDAPGPVNVYARSKLQGEHIIQQLLHEYYIVRAGWMVGGWEIDKKFVYKIVLQLLEGKKELRVVSDKFGSMTFTKDFAANLIKVARSGHFGTYHLANQGVASRYAIAVKIVEYMGLAKQVKVIAIDSSQYPLPAPRPDFEVIRNYRLDLMGKNEMPPWQDSLRAYIDLNKDKGNFSTGIFSAEKDR